MALLPLLLRLPAESSAGLNDKREKALNYKRAGVTICHRRVPLSRRVIPNKHLANNWLLTVDWNLLCPLSKEMRNGMVQNKQLKNACLQNLGPLLGITISGLLFSDTASAAIQSGLHAMFGHTHAIVLANVDPSLTKIAINLLGPLLASFNVLFIVRIVMSWYPQLPVGKFPYVIAYAPTELLLSPTRKVIPPVAGVDVSPVVWLAFTSFLNEILLGPQGLLVLLSRQGL